MYISLLFSWDVPIAKIMCGTEMIVLWETALSFAPLSQSDLLPDSPTSILV